MSLDHYGYIDGTGTETWAHCSRGWLGPKRSKTPGGAESYVQAQEDLTEHLNGGKCGGDDDERAR